MQRIDAVYHVRGESEFVDHIPPPAEMLYAAVFSSPIAHGKILALDTQAALAVDGAIAVFTAADIPGCNQWGTIIADHPCLPLMKCSMWGWKRQPITFIVGKTRAIALTLTAIAPDV